MEIIELVLKNTIRKYITVLILDNKGLGSFSGTDAQTALNIPVGCASVTVSAGGVCLGGCLPMEVSTWWVSTWGGCLPRGVCLNPLFIACWDTHTPCPLHAGIHPAPVNRITDRCKNIAFPQLRLQAVIMNYKIVMTDTWVELPIIS